MILVDMRNLYNISIENPTRMKAVGRHRRRYKYNNKMELRM
jgi:hypothetical protein